MSGYIYRGAQPEAPREIRPAEWAKPGTKPRTRLPDFNPSLCGTMNGYRQHRLHRQPQCRKCLDAHNVNQQTYRRAKRGGG